MSVPLDAPRRSDAFDIDALAAFDFDPRTRVVFGAGTIARLGELTRELGGSRVLVVTDDGIERAGHVAKAVSSLREAGLHTTVFKDVQPNPTTDDVDRGLIVAKAERIDFLVAVGGGSSMDCAKGINFLLTNGGRMQDYWGIGKATKPMLPLIAIPTTAGTGSEAQSFALIADAKTHMKMACGDKKAACRVAILDPELTLSMPASVTAATGIDAISHALESYVTTKRNPISQLFARRAWKLLARGFEEVVGERSRKSEVRSQKEGMLTDNVESSSSRSSLATRHSSLLPARGSMLLGAHLAGAAIENSMLGATHALANPLTAHYGITHGLAVGLMLPYVIRFNAPVVSDLYGKLAEDVGLCAADDPRAAELLAARVALLIESSGSPTYLSTCGVERTMLRQLAIEAAKQWTGTFNPRGVDESSLVELYEAAFDPV
ncbi:MAG: iron-containing alcohol dehydrogenase [Planctomycetota bacterium]|nr:MAG: iron-containing alcohol dehydrogenase [Planctomycetota bacterium]